MRRRRLVAEEQGGDQTATATASPVTREVSAACIKSAKPPEISVARNVAVTTKKATGALPEIGNDHNISFVIARASFEPGFPLTHIIGCSQISVPVGASDFQAAEFVDQEEVDHA